MQNTQFGFDVEYCSMEKKMRNPNIKTGNKYVKITADAHITKTKTGWRCGKVYKYDGLRLSGTEKPRFVKFQETDAIFCNGKIFSPIGEPLIGVLDFYALHKIDGVYYAKKEQK